jgi:hypothetical protein
MIRGRAIARIETIKQLLLDCSIFYDANEFTRSAEYSVSVGDMAEAACADFDAMSDCLQSARNATPDAFMFWEGLAECAASLINAAEHVYANSIIATERNN